MTGTRREFLGTLGVGIGLAAAAGLTPAARAVIRDPDPTFFTWKPLCEDVRVAFGEGGNTLLIEGKDAAILVDCKNAPFGATLRREAQALGTPVKLVINTHHHADHTGGNHAFTKDLPVIAQEKAKPRIAARMDRYISQAKEAVLSLSNRKEPVPDKVKDEVKAYHDRMAQLKPEEFQPKMLVTEGRELEVGGERVVLRYFGPGHTDNDLVVILPGRRIIHTGDLVFHKRHPFIDRDSGASTAGWIECLRSVIELCDEKTTVVPGHGEVTDMSGIKMQIDYLHTVRDIVGKAIKAGTPREEVVKLTLEPFSTYAGEQNRPMTIGAVYDELKAGG